jgi:hypothetical protein
MDMDTFKQDIMTDYYVDKKKGSATAYGRPPEKLDAVTRLTFDIALNDYTQTLDDGIHTADEWIHCILKTYKGCNKTLDVIKSIQKVMPSQRPDL